MRGLLLLTRVACLLFLAPAAFAVEGRVFVTSKGGEPIPLEGAVVRAYDVTAYRNVMKHSAAAKKKYTKMGERLTALLEDGREIGQEPVSEDERTRLLGANSADTRKLLEEIEVYPSTFLLGLALKPLAETHTDSEGRYTLTVKETDHVVFVAVGERPTGATTEHYWWTIFAPTARLDFTNRSLSTRMPWEMDGE